MNGSDHFFFYPKRVKIDLYPDFKSVSISFQIFYHRTFATQEKRKVWYEGNLEGDMSLSKTHMYAKIIFPTANSIIPIFFFYRVSEPAYPHLE